MEKHFENMELAEKQLTSEKIYEGKLLHVYRDEILLPNGHKGAREYIKHLGAVAVVAMDSDGKISVEHQFRYPFQKVLLEIPAGKLDYAGEDPLEAAKRELREETVIIAHTWQYLGPFYPTVAYSTEVIHLYWAKELEFGERELDEDESINFEMVDIKQVVDMILDGKVPDSKTQAAVLTVNTLMNR